ncbi:MAG: hypothetical protein M5U09_30565, partial [Gammaproteobacteria bacterium]|nr:hypothetical protein [Gammaproteobacteria bacterium]
VDYAFVWDPENPTRLQHYDVGVTTENYHFLIPTLTQAIYLYRHVGAFHLFDSHQRSGGVPGRAARRLLCLAVGEPVLRAAGRLRPEP